MATLFLIVGLPGAGKSTRAKELAAQHRALRLTPDEWMIPLFGDSMAGGKRFVLEGQLISVALQVLRLGTSVVLDFGLWGRDERSALRWLAGVGVRPLALAGRRLGPGRSAPGSAQVVTGKRDRGDGGHGKYGYDPPFGIAVPAIGVEPEQTLEPRRPHGRQDRRRPEEG